MVVSCHEFLHLLQSVFSIAFPCTVINFVLVIDLYVKDP